MLFLYYYKKLIELKYGNLSLFDDNFFQIVSPSSKTCNFDDNTRFSIFSFNSSISFFDEIGGVNPSFLVIE